MKIGKIVMTEACLLVMETNLMHYLSSVYFVSQSLHVSGIFVAHHQEVYCTYTTTGRCCAFQLTVCWPNWPTDSQLRSTTRTELLYIYSIPPDDGLQICPKHVEVDWRNKLRINSASSWFLLYRYIEMHGQQNIKIEFFFWPCIFIIEGKTDQRNAQINFSLINLLLLKLLRHVSAT
jgi:hypothetical protein